MRNRLELIQYLLLFTIVVIMNLHFSFSLFSLDMVMYSAIFCVVLLIVLSFIYKEDFKELRRSYTSLEMLVTFIALFILNFREYLNISMQFALNISVLMLFSLTIYRNIRSKRG